MLIYIGGHRQMVIYLSIYIYTCSQMIIDRWSYIQMVMDRWSYIYLSIYTCSQMIIDRWSYISMVKDRWSQIDGLIQMVIDRWSQMMIRLFLLWLVTCFPFPKPVSSPTIDCEVPLVQPWKPWCPGLSWHGKNWDGGAAVCPSNIQRFNQQNPTNV